MEERRGEGEGHSYLWGNNNLAYHTVMLIGKVNGHDITRNPQNILHAADAPSTFYSSACMCICTQSIIRSQLPVPPLLVQLPTWGNQLVVEFQCVSKGSNPKLITLPLGLTYNFRLNELITFALCVSRPLLSITLWQMDTKDYWTLLKRTRKKMFLMVFAHSHSLGNQRCTIHL